MTMKNGDKSAMPVHQVWEDCGVDGNSGPHFVETIQYGLTKREMMAMHMMAANRSRSSDYRSWEDMANDAIEMTDTLLAELERTK